MDESVWILLFDSADDPVVSVHSSKAAADMAAKELVDNGCSYTDLRVTERRVKH